jgi:hypothetical protein
MAWDGKLKNLPMIAEAALRDDAIVPISQNAGDGQGNDNYGIAASDLKAYAESDSVKTSGDQTITGTKTFSTAIAADITGVAQTATHIPIAPPTTQSAGSIWVS